MTKHLNHLRIASHEKERNWLKALIEVHNNHKSERFFDFGIRNAYANAYRIDVPELDDEHFIESLIQGLIEAKNGADLLNWQTQFIHSCFDVITFRMSRAKAAAKLRERLLGGIAEEQLELSIAVWERKNDYIQKQLIRDNLFENYGELASRDVSKNLFNRWPSRFSGKRPNPEYTVSRFIEELRSENMKFDWDEFLERLVPSDPNQSSTLWNHLKAINGKPSVYWYPGSGSDVNPIIYGDSDDPLSRRLLRIDNSASIENPILFWMNDLHDLFERLETSKDSEDDSAYAPTYVLAEKREDYVFNKVVPITLFSLRMQPRYKKNKFDAQNYESEYLVLFSNVPSHVLFAEVIFPIRLNVACVLLAAQGGFSGQLFGFEQYRDIPKILSLTESELGPVDVYFLDKFAHDNILLRPISPYISRYEQLESSLPCGWLPCRAFIRPELSKGLDKLSNC